MKWANLRFLLHIGALALLTIVLTPTTFVLFGFLRRSLHPANGGIEFVLILASFFLSFLVLVMVVALAFPLIAMSVGYLQHVKETRQQPFRSRKALKELRRAELEDWDYSVIAIEASSLAVQVSENRWLLAYNYFEMAKQLGEEIKEHLPLCNGKVIDVTFTRPVGKDARASWDQAEEERRNVLWIKGPAKAASIAFSLACQTEQENKPNVAKRFWNDERSLQLRLPAVIRT